MNRKGDKQMKTSMIVEDIQNQISALAEVESFKASNTNLFTGGFSRLLRAIKLAFSEKEIFTFASLQLCAIIITYYIWVQFLGWIPESIWNDDESLAHLALNLVFLLWSFLCVGFASFFIGLLSGCMGASVLLKKTGRKSTIASCFLLVVPNIKNVWIFSWIDGWITVNQILERIPKKNWSWRPSCEIPYYAWKFGTVGILPSSMIGNNLIESGKDSIDLIKARTLEVLTLRIQYSFFCWIVGIATYIGSLVFFTKCNDLFIRLPGIEGFYLLMGIPIIIAAAVVVLVLRPIYIISCFDVYSDYLREEKREIPFEQTSNLLDFLFVSFIVLFILLLLIFFNGIFGVDKIISDILNGMK